jgi:phosphoribosylaminoimidazole-succinocarboxamide synthase
MVVGCRRVLYAGSTKVLYVGVKPNTVIMQFNKDEYDTQRNKVSELIWTYLTTVGIDNHFLKVLNVREQVIKAVQLCPVFLRIHNIANPEMYTRLGILPGTVFSSPFIEWHLKSNLLKDPMISRDHIEYFKWVKCDEMKQITKLATRANDVLRAMFYYLGLKPSMMQFAFGSDESGMLMLAGELSPETITFWDDRAGDILSQEEVYSRLKGKVNIPS